MRADQGQPSPDDWGSLRRGRITYLPVVPGKLEFAVEVRRRILEMQPDIVAVELPETLESGYLEAIRRLPQISVIFYSDTTPGVSVYREDSGASDAVYVPVEPCDPFVEAVRSGEEVHAEVIFADPDSTERPHVRDVYPDTYALHSIPLDQFVEAYRLHPQARTPEIESFAEGIAWKLQGLDPLATVLVVVSLNMLDPLLDAMERPQSEPKRRRREGLALVNAHPDCLGEILTDYPFLQERYESFRATLEDAASVDRRKTQIDLFREAGVTYELNTGEKLHAWQRRLMGRYSRNLSITDQSLTASLHDLTVCARGIVDENYAWEVWETASRYSHQQTSNDLETVDISGDEVWVSTKRLRLAPAPAQREAPNGKPRP